MPTINGHSVFHYLLTFFLGLFKSIITSVIWIIIGGLGLVIYESKKSPYDLIFGLPLILIGIGLIINNLVTVLTTLFSSIYNKGMCPICKNNHTP